MSTIKTAFDTLKLDVDDQHIATLTINRPDKLNSLNNKVLGEIEEAVRQIEHSDDIKGVIVTGAGDKAFVAGADIKELNDLNEGTGAEQSRYGQRVFRMVEKLRKPVVAVVNGYALGGGAELAMACHLRIASTNAKIGLPEVTLGLIPGYGGTQRLTRLVGRTRALEMILSGKPIDADKAYEYGVVNRVEEQTNAMEAAHKLLSGMLKNAPIALANALQAVEAAEDFEPEGYEREARLFGALCRTKDFREGTNAFLEKRKPSFKGE